MSKPVPISYNDFKQQFAVNDIDLVQLGLFTEEDFKTLEKSFGYLRGVARFKNVIANIPTFFSNRENLLDRFVSAIRNQTKDFKKYSCDTNTALKDRYPISDYIHKASIIAAFKPKTILEIGTFFGWGTVSIKAANPEATVYTMNLKETDGANNPIPEEEIGSVCRKKGMGVTQIWADSTRFDYSILPEIDCTYIDGNHEYEFVRKDLENTSKITKKVILLDDYIPSESSPRGDVRAWGPWNEGVVNATNNFLAEHGALFKHAYWIQETPICVLVV